MHFSLIPYVICAAVSIVVRHARAQGTLPQGLYRIENTAFVSPVLVLDLFPLPSPGTPISVFQNNGGQNQLWIVTTSGGGYTLTAINPMSHIFVDSFLTGTGLTGTPNNQTTLLFNQIGIDTYQILAARGLLATALQAPVDVGQVTLEPLDATNLHQIWRMVLVLPL